MLLGDIFDLWVAKQGFFEISLNRQDGTNTEYHFFLVKMRLVVMYYIYVLDYHGHLPTYLYGFIFISQNQTQGPTSFF